MINEDWKTQPEPTETSAVLWGHQNGEVRLSAHDGAGWYHSGGGRWLTWPQVLAYIAEYGDGTPPRIVDLAEPKPEPERVVVWESGGDLDKLRPYIGKEGVEVRAESGGAVVAGPLKDVHAYGMRVGGLSITESVWDITVTATKPLAPWWEVESVEEGHIVSWTETASATHRILVWHEPSPLAEWRSNWDEFADPTTWRVTDVHAAGGPKLIAGTAS